MDGITVTDMCLSEINSNLNHEEVLEVEGFGPNTVKTRVAHVNFSSI